MLRGLVRDGKCKTINDGLLHLYKTDNPDIQTFRTYNGWKREGCQVKKGSKAFLIWGTPRTATNQEAEENQEDEFKFFPIAYLFADTQVECEREDPKGTR